MNKIELPCPKGFTFLGYKLVNPGNWYSSEPGEEPTLWPYDQISLHRYFVFEKKQPRRIVFEEVIGATILHEGDYYTDEYTPIPDVWTEYSYDITDDDRTTIWRLINDNQC